MPDVVASRRDFPWRSLPALVFVAQLLFYSSGAAHSLRIFTDVDGTIISGRVYYDGNEPAVGVAVRVENPSGETVARVTTDADGRFQCQVRYRADYLVVADTLDLHRAETRIAANEFGDRLPPIDVDPHVREVVDQATREQLQGEIKDDIRQLREQMDRLENSIGLRDIVGGIGFILCILGVVLFLKRRSQ